MAKRKKKGSRRRSRGRKRGSRASTPKTLSGVFRQSPLAVKAGAVLSGFEVATKPTGTGDTALNAVIKMAKGQATATYAASQVKAAAMNPQAYKPLAIGFLIHWVNKKTIKIKGV